MSIERVLITVRTYPTLSKKHIETVCTAGINSDGVWRRLYPVPFRLLDEEKQYRTFDVVTVKLGSNPDGRPESRKPDAATIKVVDTIKGWDARRQWVLPTATDSMAELVSQGRTIAPVRVQEVLEFVARPDSAEWSPEQQELLRQNGLFEGPTPLEKLPFDFRLRWRDGEGAEHDSMFLAWEVGQTWRNFNRLYSNAVERMRDEWMLKRFGPDHDIWFFMGNFAKRREVFGVCGTFTPPKEAHPSVNLWSS